MGGASERVSEESEWAERSTNERAREHEFTRTNCIAKFHDYQAAHCLQCLATSVGVVGARWCGHRLLILATLALAESRAAGKTALEFEMMKIAIMCLLAVAYTAVATCPATLQDGSDVYHVSELAALGPFSTVFSAGGSSYSYDVDPCNGVTCGSTNPSSSINPQI